MENLDFRPHAPNSLSMHRSRLHIFLRLAAIALLVANLVPEALTALPVCQYDFAPARIAASYQPAPAGVSLGHSHDTNAAHECLATMPDEVCAAKLLHNAPDMAVAILSSTPVVPALPITRGPSPRGSPFGVNAYLVQRSSVLLLI